MVLPLGGSNKDPGTPGVWLNSYRIRSWLYISSHRFCFLDLPGTSQSRRLELQHYTLTVHPSVPINIPTVMVLGTLRGALRVEGDGSRREYLGAGRSSIDARSRPVSLARSRLGRQNRYRNPE
ncbi:uncharacterized protein ACIBXB_018737 [Morphnus guianensis]